MACLNKSEENQHCLDNSNVVNKTNDLNMKLETINNFKPIESESCIIEYMEENATSNNAQCEKICKICSLSSFNTEDTEKTKSENKTINDIKIIKNTKKSSEYTEKNVLEIKGESNSSLSFKFIEHTKAELENSDINFNDDSDNYIRIKVNVDLVANDSLNITTYTKSETEVGSMNTVKCKELNSSQNTILPVQNDKPNKSIIKNKYVGTEPIKINENKKSSCIKSVVLNKTDMLLSHNLEKYLFKYLHEKHSVHSIIHYGRFSKIFKCKDSAGKEYALKMLR